MRERIFLLLICGAALTHCGGGGGSAGGASEGAVRQSLVNAFRGLDALDIQEDRSYLLSWAPVVANDIVYAIFSAPENQSFDFTAPLVTTTQNVYEFRPENLFAPVATCFVVRITGSTDENTTTLCTKAEVLDFKGLKDAERQADGGYLLRWDPVAISDISYSVYVRRDNAEFNFNLPSFDAITETFQKTPVYERGEVRCFVVRYVHIDLEPDSNTKEVCTDREPPLDFSGVSKVETVSKTSVRVSWALGSTEEIHKYQIFQGSDFNTLVGEVDASIDHYVVESLVAGRQYSFGVRAADEFGRQDDNIIILSVVLPE